MNDAATAPVTLTSVTTGGGPVVINGTGNVAVVAVNAGRGAVSLASLAGSLLNGVSGGASVTKPNVTGGVVTLNGAGTVGTQGDRVYVDAGALTAAAPGGAFINTPPTPYSYLPLLQDASPVTVHAAFATAQFHPPLQLPITSIGQPLPTALPMNVSADSLGIALPDGVLVDATQQDATMDTASKPILGGNEEEIGRAKAASRSRKSSGATL
jgi:hypothetical protein